MLRFGSAEPMKRLLESLSAGGKCIRGEAPGTSCTGKDVKHDQHSSQYNLERGKIKEADQCWHCFLIG